MKEIELKQLDKLFNISVEIGILSYLQKLVELDAADRFIDNGVMNNTATEALPYLINRQYDAVKKLWELLDSEDFPK